MNDNNPQELSNEQFSDDAEENLRVENEILHLKLKAELGGELVNDPELPLELENEFLKNILAFEHAHTNVKQVKIYDLIGNPPFKKAVALSDAQLSVVLKDITEFLKRKNIIIEFNEAYDNRLKYTFITEELFEHEVDDVQLPGITRHFSYEEFHQNHQLEIETRAAEFMSDWFEQRLNEDSWELGDPFVLDDGSTIGKDVVLLKIQMVFDAYTAFTAPSYQIETVHYEIDEDTAAGLGSAAGMVKYTAQLESGEQIEIEGPFKLYLSLQEKWWTIFYFYFPGFEW